jgi:hypothetical protein
MQITKRYIDRCSSVNELLSVHKPQCYCTDVAEDKTEGQSLCFELLTRYSCWSLLFLPLIILMKQILKQRRRPQTLMRAGMVSVAVEMLSAALCLGRPWFE